MFGLFKGSKKTFEKQAAYDIVKYKSLLEYVKLNIELDIIDLVKKIEEEKQNIALDSSIDSPKSELIYRVSKYYDNKFRKLYNELLVDEDLKEIVTDGKKWFITLKDDTNIIRDIRIL